jgi:hypothetical protein
MFTIILLIYNMHININHWFNTINIMKQLDKPQCKGMTHVYLDRHFKLQPTRHLWVQPKLLQCLLKYV